MAEVSKGGQSTSERISSASVRPKASRSGIRSAGRGAQAPARISSASETVITSSFYGLPWTCYDSPRVPIYEYVCAKCGKKTEVIQSFKQAPPKGCPHCGGKLKKAFSAPAIQFKGSGFYITDYAARTGQPSERSEKSEKSESSDKAEKSDKSEKSDRAEKSEKSDKAEKSGKSEKTGGPEKSGRTEKKKDKKPAD